MVIVTIQIGVVGQSCESGSVLFLLPIPIVPACFPCGGSKGESEPLLVIPYFFILSSSGLELPDAIGFLFGRLVDAAPSIVLRLPR